MKKILFSLVLMASSWAVLAQTEPFQFKEYKRSNATSVKNQGSTGTCWAFSTVSFLESEALRMGKKDVDISEMFIVRHIYRLKCENYVRRQGHAQLSEGGLAHDVMLAAVQYGLMPEAAYPGRANVNAPLNHGKLEKNLRTLCTEFVKQGKEGKLPADWLKQVDTVLDEEFGPVPTKFEYKNIQFTPSSYRDYLGIQPADYVTITSFTHHPFWTKFILEVPDNWSNGEMYNVPVSDLMRVANSSLEKGYSVEWDADVSNEGFSAQNGVALVPEKTMKQKDASAQANTFKMWEPELKITQENRQELFDRQVTTDDHLMHIVGLLDEAHTGLYYVVKNSWGEISDNKGFVYCSEAYMRQNTISFTVHKSAIPEDIAKRLGLLAGEATIEQENPNMRTQRKPDMQLTPAPSLRMSKSTPGVTPAQKTPAKKSSDN